MTERGEKECPIDGVGFQNHIDINFDEENFESIRENI
jgi:GH35 family endo-1,4-beta-xylanase